MPQDFNIIGAGQIYVVILHLEFFGWRTKGVASFYCQELRKPKWDWSDACLKLLAERRLTRLFLDLTGEDVRTKSNHGDLMGSRCFEFALSKTVFSFQMEVKTYDSLLRFLFRHHAPRLGQYKVFGDWRKEELGKSQEARVVWATTSGSGQLFHHVWNECILIWPQF